MVRLLLARGIEIGAHGPQSSSFFWLPFCLSPFSYPFCGTVVKPPHFVRPRLDFPKDLSPHSHRIGP